jgi:hypothetical protein
MGWREVLEEAEIASDFRPGGSEQLGFINAGRVADWLLAMPTPDRIALARELLAGTGRVVARDVEELLAYLPANSALLLGWNACRAAMLEPDDAGG